MYRITKTQQNPVILRVKVIAALAVLAICFLAPAAAEVYAAESGTAYLASATPSYKHPVTGKIEDSGQNEGIGQCMTESVLYKKALVEITDSGAAYATVRLYMMDNISKIRFWVQEKGASGWSKSSAQIMQENIGGKYCSDYRIKLPSKSAIIKMRMYVSAMGRDVTFYARLSGLKEGHGNFITSVAASTKKSNSTDSTAASASSGNTAADKATTASGEGSELLEDEDGLTTSQDQETEQAKASGASESLPALSWVLVLQCILIILIPALVVGGGLMGLLIYIKNREELER